MNTIDIREENGGHKVVMPDNFTAPLVPILKKQLKQLIDGGSRAIVFDMAATRMLDSSGIGLLTATANSLATAGGRMEVVAVAPEIFRLLKMMRLVERLNVSE